MRPSSHTNYQRSPLSNVNNFTAKVHALKVARRDINSEAMSKYYLKSGGIGEYDEQPKYLEVTKRLYRPYDKLFCNTVD